MKQNPISFKFIAAFTLLVLVAGCAATHMSTRKRENMLIASGFVIVTPKNAAQEQKLQALPPDKIAIVKKDGKTYYVFPDAANNVAYVGGLKAYQYYHQLRAAAHLEDEGIESGSIYQDPTMQWGTWNGWEAGPNGTGAVAVGRSF